MLKKTITLLSFIILFTFGLINSVAAAPSDDFVTTWKTDNPGTSNSTSITIPTTGLGYNYDVDWNNDGVFDEFGITGDVTHDFGIAGTYTIRIQGSFPRIYFNNTGDKLKIISIDQWGTQVWTSMNGAFYGCTFLNGTISDTPNLSLVTDMSYMFSKTSNFNQPLNSWDVSSVTNMENLFSYSFSFNQPLDSWDVSSVTNMGYMFYYAQSFNQPLDSWDVSSVTDMKELFRLARVFNQPLNSWDVSSVTDMDLLFSEAHAFNQPLNSWDVSSVTSMRYTLASTDFFNQPLNSWDVSSVVYMDGIFRSSLSFNQPLDSWDVSSVTSMGYMFLGASNFNQPLNSWDVSSVIYMFDMFSSASSFNQPLNSWDVSSVVDMVRMFKDAISFDQNLNTWNLASLIPSIKYEGANEMFLGSKLSTINYDALLVGWNSFVLQNGITFDGGNSTYCSSAAETARTNIIATYGWTIIDGGKDCTPPTPSATPDIIAPSDSGSSNTDDITMITTPAIDVTCSTVGNTINIYSDYPVTNTLIGTQVCTTVGTETVPTSTLAGVQNIIFTDKNGTYESPASAPLAVVIDIIAPVVPVIDRVSSGDTSISGTGETGTTITLNGITCSNSPVIVDALGKWECSGVNPLPRKGDLVSTRSTDIAGNFSTGSFYIKKDKKSSKRKTKKEINNIFQKTDFSKQKTKEKNITDELNPFNGEQCPSELIIHDFMRNGDTNGKYGSYNKGIVTDIDILQKHMNRLLVDQYGKQAAGPVDGIFRSLTHKGVERLQRKLNQLLPNMTPLVIDGIVGPFTRQAINNSC